MKKIKIICFFLAILIVSWSAIFSTDYYNAKDYEKPIISFKVTKADEINFEYVEYTCLFYKIKYVTKHNDLDLKEVIITPWFKKNKNYY